jgi:hypothetical protein
MPLPAGTRPRHYDITARPGEGGMDPSAAEFCSDSAGCGTSRHLGPVCCALMGVLVLLLAGCDGSPTAPGVGSNLIVHLTDGHTDDVDEVNIFFASVTANPTDGPPELLELALEENPQDLLVLQDAVITLATSVVEPGEYASLMINLDQEQSNVVEAGEERPLRIPSQEIKILGGFTVSEDGVTTVTLDFQAEESLVKLGNGDWLLTPVITMEVAVS